MRKLLNILLTFFCVIASILSIAFIFIEGRLLFSLEWLVFDNAFNGAIRYIFRLLIAIFALFVFVFNIINIFKKNKSIQYLLYFADVSLLISSIIIGIFATNYVGLVLISLTSIIVLINIGLFLTNKKDAQ